ncbi:MAG: SAM-dependent chlorinase/fluorinase [Deltaproteobacteria bacterium]|nr:SAM-dependent chlorinase/fluorinase [Deltaproteobacteria bacterium]MBW1960198.1 SAM-dependent chlorinase/fluorinase [Deltaproteobacteria bacterium]MBW2150601.1 SAM-dependent chlorinase/fluorinase [Deltaproteobacteria bacterium]
MITLTTDFGLTDEYVGVMKGVILSINPRAVIVDISHNIDPQDVTQAAYVIKSAYRYFPAQTVHVIVVDPGVGSDRAVIALRYDGHFFLAPDNGVLSFLLNNDKIEAVIRVENSRYFLKDISWTFHGRDIFAPVAAYISMGVKLEDIGNALDPVHLVQLEIQKPKISLPGEIVGTIIAVDRFGNLITNIDVNVIRFLGAEALTAIDVWIGGKKISGISKSYNSVDSGHPLSIIGSRGYLEIAVNCGNAADKLEARKGDAVRLRVSSA